ncbi:MULTISPECIES: hypothetical protein [Rhizobium]|uniref:hypothetical protein n=1 Tax=Rhizobium TaxID=379 RepID=UPI001FDEC4B6|nr:MULTISPECIES: hypothetical protein [Rhizobium]WSH11021.1 hypothetical protein U8P72_28410 [Rhizobium johnstonii]WSH48790.1 hypothetical protein U8P77_34345 [Rhizobium johnstonii]
MKTFCSTQLSRPAAYCHPILPRVDLQVLSALFQIIETDEIEAIIRATPTGAFARRLWFLYEWLTDRQLDIPDPGKVRMVTILDPDQQYALAEGDPSPRHKVSNNLPGTPAFCPLVRRTPDLAAFSQKALGERAREAMGRVRPDLVAREWPTQSVRDFHGRPLPERGEPAGYAAIMARYDLILPPPIRMTAIAERHHPTSTEAWLMLTPRYRPQPELGPHLVFAFRYEGAHQRLREIGSLGLDPTVKVVHSLRKTITSSSFCEH